ncbi:branched-chain amino acid ABC transporter permease, partial [Pseudoxanthobacter sp.]|uniref:branched-chain amino acid ABC transporter permease n=1 Tax=Pseudoxanthobacter sp. TaxID=1925742 RepID=UPI002FDF2429
VLVFTVTRIIMIPQGEFISFAALTLAQIQQGQTPAIIGLLVGLGLLAGVMETVAAVRARAWRRLPLIALWTVGVPVAISAGAAAVAPLGLGLGVDVLVTLLLVAPLGPYLYRVAFQPIADASVLVLLITAMAIHVALIGLGLVMFGAEGARVAPFSDAMVEFGTLFVSGQSIAVIGASILFMAGFYLVFERTMTGRALRATAVNRLGARLVGISTVRSGQIVFFAAAFVGALSGILIAPLTTVYYDTGFLIGLKGFVAAIVGGLASYPLAAAAAIALGVIESLTSFWASAFKEVIVFTVIIPVLVWRSLSHPHAAEDEHGG